MKSMVLLLLVHCAAGTVRTHRELLGYLENWDSEDTIWWSNDLPGTSRRSSQVFHARPTTT